MKKFLLLSIKRKNVRVDSDYENEKFYSLMHFVSMIILFSIIF